jgi:hypothetical protein
MAVAQIQTITPLYPESPTTETYYQNRPQSNMPMGDNGPWTVNKDAVLTNTSRTGEVIELRTSDIDVTISNATGFWQGTNFDEASKNIVNVSTWHDVGLAVGTLVGSRDTIMYMNAAPIRDFTGIAFKWNTRGSYWDDTGYHIRSNTSSYLYKGMFMACFHAETGKITWQRLYEAQRVGQDITASEISNTSDTSILWWTLTESDQDWVRTNPIYLIGLGLQYWPTSIGGTSQQRQFNIWDAQIMYNDPRKGQSYQHGKQIAFDRTARGIGNHYGYYNEASKILTH